MSKIKHRRNTSLPVVATNTPVKSQIRTNLKASINSKLFEIPVQPVETWSSQRKDRETSTKSKIFNQSASIKNALKGEISPALKVHKKKINPQPMLQIGSIQIQVPYKPIKPLRRLTANRSKSFENEKGREELQIIEEIKQQEPVETHSLTLPRINCQGIEEIRTPRRIIFSKIQTKSLF